MSPGILYDASRVPQKRGRGGFSVYGRSVWRQGVGTARFQSLRGLGFVVLFFCLSIFRGVAGTSFSFRHLTVDDGLPSNSVRGIAQDELGRIWFAAEGYLSCYDGVKVRNFAVSFPGAEDGFLDHYIKDLKSGGDGVLWCATDIGLIRYDFISNTFGLVDARSADGTGITSIVSSLAQDREGRIWCATFGQGVFSYNPSDSTLRQYHPCPEDINVYGICTDSDDNVWAAVLDTVCPVYGLDRGSDRFVPAVTGYDVPQSRSGVTALYEDSEGILWLGSWEGGLQRLDRRTGRVTAYCFDYMNMGRTFLHIHSVTEYDDGVLLVGSDYGLMCFETATGEYRVYEPDLRNRNSISDSFVYPILRDREGGVWAGTYYRGVNYIPPGSGRFEGNDLSSITGSRHGHIVSHITEGPDSTVWIGMDDGGLIHYFPDTGQGVHYMPGDAPGSLSYHNIHSLCFDGNDLWVGTYTGGINILDTGTGTFRRLGDHSGPVDNSSVYSILKDRDGDIWVGSLTGISRYDRASGSFEQMLPLSHTPVSMVQDRRGRIWCATIGGGLYRYSPGSSTWTGYRKRGETDSGLTSDYVTCIYIDDDGVMWLSTKDGLCRYDEDTDRFIRVEIPEVECTDFTAVTGDGGSLWITSSAGLVRFFPGGRAFVFTVSDGLMSDQYLTNSVMRSSDGRIYVGSDCGISSFRPDRVTTNGYVPPVLVTGVRMYGEELEPGRSEILPKAIPYTDRIVFPRRTRMVGFTFASLSYAVPEKNRYAYILEGFDRDWNCSGGDADVTYTNLPYGTYRFKVRASNNDGVWNDAGAEVIVTLPPPLLLSALFISIYAVLVVFLIWLGVRILLKRAEKRHQLSMDKLREEKERELYESRMKLCASIAHEIRTPVSYMIDHAAANAANPADAGFLVRLGELIEQNFADQNLSVSFLASELGISRSGLFSKVKSLLEITPNELIQLVRLKKGAGLLIENKYQINEICYMVGFSSPSYFSRCFQKQFGMKPNDFVRSVNGSGACD